MDIQSQIQHWELTRKLQVLMYYCKKEGYKNLGLQILPTTQISEYNAKLAIQMVILLKSLSKSEYGNETWSLTDTSAEIVLTPPKNTFKKGGFQVEVMYDGNPDNVNVYTQWDYIYYQDENERWHKVPGEVDYNGLLYTDIAGDKNYFLLFHEDADRYSVTGQWVVSYKHTTITSIVTSSSRHSGDSEKSQPRLRNTRESSPEEGPSRGRQSPRNIEEVSTTTTTSPPASGRRRRRGGGGGGESQRREQREYSSGESPGAKRQRGPTAPSPEEVGRRHQSIPRHGLDRLRRLQEEARDPPLICVKGSANNLKCWRYRCNDRFGYLFYKISSVFKWIGDDECINNSRMLITFKSIEQRTQFLQAVRLPRGSTYVYGALDAL